MLVYLIGPSKVGKSTYAKALCDDPKSNAVHIDVDDWLEQKYDIRVSELHGHIRWGQYKRWDAFFLAAEALFLELERDYPTDDSVCIIDVGAGCLMSPLGKDYFYSNPNALALRATFEECFERNKDAYSNRTEEEYRRDAFSTDHIKVCESLHIIDVSGLDEKQAIQEFKDELPKILTRIKSHSPSTPLPEE